MKEQRIVIDLPADIWRMVGIAAAYMGKTRKEFVAEELKKASENIIVKIN